MGYPQPNANDAVIRGLNQFRLFTPLTSPGDIYESEQGCYAVALGPDSDVARVNVVYFDANQNPLVAGFTGMTSVEISPQRAFVGNLPARNDAVYQPSSRKARTLFYVDDLYDPSYRPAGIHPVSGQVNYITPNLDIIQYFQPVDSMTPGRNDREYYFQDIPPAPGQAGALASYIVLPFYGRAYAFIQMTNFSGHGVTLGVLGVNYAITNDALIGPSPIHQETTLLAPFAMANGSQKIKIIRAAVDGTFDALVISLLGTVGQVQTPTPLKIVMSDNPL